GRPLPRPWDVDFAIRGFEFYDGPVFVRDVYFEAFAPNAVRQAGALSILSYTDFYLSPLNRAERLAFGPGTNVATFESRLPPTDPAEREYGEDGYRSGLFQDVDGSVTGTPGTIVTVDNPVLATDLCSYRA